MQNNTSLFLAIGMIKAEKLSCERTWNYILVTKAWESLFEKLAKENKRFS